MADKLMTDAEWRSLSAQSRHAINLYVKVCEEKGARLRQAELTLATLCDIVLGEDASDRSDDTLIRAVGHLIHRDGFIVCRVCECAEAITSDGLCGGCDTARKVLQQKGMR